MQKSSHTSGTELRCPGPQRHEAARAGTRSTPTSELTRRRRALASPAKLPSACTVRFAPGSLAFIGETQGKGCCGDRQQLRHGAREHMLPTRTHTPTLPHSWRVASCSAGAQANCRGHWSLLRGAPRPLGREAAVFRPSCLGSRKEGEGSLSSAHPNWKMLTPPPRLSRGDGFGSESADRQETLDYHPLSSANGATERYLNHPDPSSNSCSATDTPGLNSSRGL